MVVVSRHRLVPWEGRCAIQADDQARAADRLTLAYLEHSAARVLLRVRRDRVPEQPDSERFLERLRGILRACAVDIAVSPRWGGEFDRGASSGRRRGWLLLDHEMLPCSQLALQGIADIVVADEPSSTEDKYGTERPPLPHPKAGGCRVLPSTEESRRISDADSRADVLRYGIGPSSHVDHVQTGRDTIFRFGGVEWRVQEPKLTPEECRTWSLLISAGLLIVPEARRLRQVLVAQWDRERNGETACAVAS